MKKIKFPTDRMRNSTDNNGYAEGFRDETLWEEDIVDTDVPFDDEIPDDVDETGEADRPVYNEEGYRSDIAD